MLVFVENLISTLPLVMIKSSNLNATKFLTEFTFETDEMHEGKVEKDVV
jgi:hypothetical protein